MQPIVIFNLMVICAVPIMKGAESNGTIAWHNWFDLFNLWLIMLNILKDPQNGSISSPHY